MSYSPGVRVGTRRSTRTMLSLTLIFASCFPYFFVGPFPAWIFFGVICLLLAALHGYLRPATLKTGPMLVALASWTFLMCTMLLFDAVTTCDRDVLAGVGLTFLTFLTFMGVMAAASYTSSSSTALIVFGCATAQGLVAILQFTGMSWAWLLPDTIAAAFSVVTKVPILEVSELNEWAFERIGRARGTHFFVHVYNGVQCVLVAFCVFVSFHTRDPRLSRWKIFLQIGAIIAVTGLLLSFSRTGMLSLLCIMMVTLAYRPRIKRVASVTLAASAFLTVLAWLNFDQAAQFARLLSFELQTATNEARVVQFTLAFSNFAASPLMGTSGLSNAETLALPIHSVPLRFLNDYGIFGFILYFCILGGIVIFFFRASRVQDGSISMWGACGLSVVLAIVSDSWLHSSGFMRRDIVHAIMMGLVAGNILAARRMALQQRRKQQASLRKEQPRHHRMMVL